MITATAPGKLFLSGEWAVLRGAPAIVVAVERRAVVELDVEPGSGTLVVESRAEGRTWRGVSDGHDRPDGDAGAVLAALRRVGAVRGCAVVDSRAFLIGERKLGLGRSAATLAAAVGACRRRAQRPTSPQALLDDALVANLDFQGGQGSGADVAAAVYGGVVEARRCEGRLQVVARALPAGVHLIAGWTGAPAHTPPMLARFADMPAPPAFTALAATATVAAAAVRDGDAGALCAAVAESGELRARFGDEAGLPIVTPALRRVLDVARAAGAVAKPSGAGGGDCGIALTTSPAVAAAVRAAWREAGVLPLDVTVASEGVVVG